MPIDSIKWMPVLDEVHIARARSWHWVQTSVLKIGDFKAGKVQVLHHMLSSGNESTPGSIHGSAE